MPLDRSSNELVVLVEVKRSGRDIVHAKGSEPGLPFHERPASAGIVVMQQRVPREIGRARQGPIRIANQIRTANGQDVFLQQLDRAGGGRVRRKIANGEVDFPLLEVQTFVGGGDANVGCRMPGKETRQARNQPQRSQPHCRRHGQWTSAAASPQPAGRLLKPFEHIDHATPQALSFRRQCQFARPAFKQLDAEVVFQRLDLPAYRGLGQQQFFGRLRKAESPGGGLKPLDELQRRQTISPACHSLPSCIG